MSMTSTNLPTGQTIAAIERAMDVLIFFANSPSRTHGVTEIANALSLSKAVVHRILSSFRAKGFIALDENTRRYTLGPQSLYLGLSYMEGIDVKTLARPVMEDLVAKTNETSTLSLRVGRTRVYIDQVTPPRDVKMVVQLGRPVPLHAGASSKAFLAFLSETEITQYLAEPLDKLTDTTVTDVSALRAELDEIRSRGYSTSIGERLEGAAAVAAPVFGHDGAPSAVISVSGPVERFRDQADAAAKLLVSATKDLSRQLGYTR
jgi:IclR family transcriptional regulator, acetate operon repressor